MLQPLIGLSPPFNFAVSTTAPNLFFEDRYLDVVTALSVFTHADDLSMSYLLELRRILKTNGYLYATFHTESAVEFLEKNPDRALAKRIKNERLAELVQENDVCRVCLGRDIFTRVFHKKAFLKETLSKYFSIVNITEGAVDGFQTAFLLKKEM